MRTRWFHSLLACVAATGAAHAQNELWTVQHGTTSWDRSSTAAADGAGGIFVGGITGGSFGGPHIGQTDGWLGRFDAAGNPSWLRHVGTNVNDDVTAIAPDAAGGLYLVGTTDGDLAGASAGKSDAWIARYDVAGNQLWIRQFAIDAIDETFTGDFATAAAADGAGGAFVAGYTGNGFGDQSAGYNDIFLTRYDADGNQVWTRLLETPLLDMLFGAAPDGSGGVFIGGHTGGNLGGPNSGLSDVWIARYDSAGDQLWIRQFGTTASDGATGLCSDTAGGVLVAGETRGALGGAAGGNALPDAWIARFDPAGNQKWIRQLGTPTIDEVMFCAQDGSGGCFVGGETHGALGGPKQGNVNDMDTWLARYDREGDLLWVKQVGTSAADHAFGAASDGVAGVYLFGHTGGVLGASSMGGPDDVFVARYGGECQAGKSYCTALTTSGGCLPSMDSDGVPSLAKPASFVVRAQALESGQLGLVYFGTTGPASVPFLGGTLCVGSPVYRLPAGAAGGSTACAGQLQYTLSALLAHPSGSLLTPGTEVHCQAWFRDPPAALGVGLTNGLRFTICN